MILCLDIKVVRKLDTLFTEIKEEVEMWEFGVSNTFRPEEVQLMISVSHDKPHPFLTFWGKRLAATGKSLTSRRVVVEFDSYKRRSDDDTHVIMSPQKGSALKWGLVKGINDEFFPPEVMQVCSDRCTVCVLDRSGNRFTCRLQVMCEHRPAGLSSPPNKKSKLGDGRV